MNWLALVDLDPMIYRAGFALEHTNYVVTVGDEELFFPSYEAYKAWVAEERPSEDVLSTTVKSLEVKDNPGIAISILRDLVSEAVMSTVSFGHPVELYLTGSGNFREQLFSGYKASRKGRRKPAVYDALRDYAVKHMGAIVVDGMEADDMLAIRATQHGEGAIIISIDKDLLTVPGEHYDPQKQVFETTTQLQSCRYFYQQLLTGDSSDDIPGLRGVGPKRAALLLGACTTEFEMWQVCLQNYNKHGEEATICRNAKLLYMLRSTTDSWEVPTSATGNYPKETLSQNLETTRDLFIS